MNEILLYEASKKQWLKFQEPVGVITTNNIEEVVSKISLVHRSIEENNLYGAGFISYEASSGFDSILKTNGSSNFPLLWFGLYEKPTLINLPSSSYDYSLDWQPNITESEYNRSIAKIKEYIFLGDTYQVNYTMKLLADFKGDSWEYFLKLIQAQQANYGAYLDIEDYIICCASPELFFSLDNNKIVTRPMKGTVARGYSLKEDEGLSKWLYNSEKNRAENVMIVDMIRNDLSRISLLNTVRVESLFDVEKYPTLWQMTSTVTGETNKSLDEIFSALFPCASITGAPKSRTMEIITELEKEPRNIYTGTIGYISPNKKAQFNVAIRTVSIDKKNSQAEYGVGGGIVWDSLIKKEYLECQIKARVLTANTQQFSLLETILWTSQNGYFILEEHLQRLRKSATYFNFVFNLENIEKYLLNLETTLLDKPYKVRLLLDSQGQIKLEAIPLSIPRSPQPVKLKLASSPIDTNNPFIYHKTTNRTIYNNILNSHSDCDDVLLYNLDGEITETCIANIVVKLNDELLTPPIQSGLLSGTFRSYLIKQGKIKEKIIRLEDLENCQGLYLINSVQKWRNAFLLITNC